MADGAGNVDIRPRQLGLFSRTSFVFGYCLLVSASCFCKKDCVLCKFPDSSFACFIHEFKVVGLIVRAPIESLFRRSVKACLKPYVTEYTCIAIIYS